MCKVLIQPLWGKTPKIEKTHSQASRTLQFREREREREKRHKWTDPQFNHEDQPASHGKLSTSSAWLPMLTKSLRGTQEQPFRRVQLKGQWAEPHEGTYSSYTINGIFKKGWPIPAYFSGFMFPHSLVPIWDSRINKLLKVSQLHLQDQGLPIFAQNVPAKPLTLSHTLSVSNPCSFFKTQLMLFQEAFPDSYS